MHIMSVLTPYMPPTGIKRSIALQLPIVIISNVVQNVAGYQQFSRKICPTVSPASIHSFKVDAAAIYEMMSSTEVQENFIIFDHLDQPITSATWATANKESTFAAF